MKQMEIVNRVKENRIKQNIEQNSKGRKIEIRDLQLFIPSSCN